MPCRKAMETHIAAVMDISLHNLELSWRSSSIEVKSCRYKNRSRCCRSRRRSSSIGRGVEE